MFKPVQTKMAAVIVAAATTLTITGCGINFANTIAEPTTETSTETSTESAPADFNPAKNGDHFKFGETVDIKATSYDGADFYLQLRVDPREPITSEQVSKNTGGEEIEGLEPEDELFCFPVTITYVSVEGIEGVEDADYMDVPSIHTRPVDAVGNSAGIRYYDGEVACGVHRSDRLPLWFKELEVGKEYKTAELATDSPGGPVADALMIEYDQGEQEHEIYFEM